MKHRVGTKLLAIREERQLSQAEMADLLDLPTSTYSRFERNEASPELDKLVSFSNILGVPLQNLLPDSVAMTNQVNNAGYGGGVVFGNQYYYTTDNEQISKLQKELEQLKTEMEKFIRDKM
jgi:transcriptional regulator with XRE-family HTH domain